MANGYVRLGTGVKREMEHRKVWRKYHGPIPPGFFIHHLDGDKKNNDINNLSLVDVLTHKRFHTGCKLVNGEWFKPCHKCGEFKEVISSYYKRKPSGVMSLCKQCFLEKDRAYKRIKYHKNKRNL